MLVKQLENFRKFSRCWNLAIDVLANHFKKKSDTVLQDVHTRKEGTVDAAFGLINSLTHNKRALSISPIQGTLQSLFTGS